MPTRISVLLFSATNLARRMKQPSKLRLIIKQLQQAGHDCRTKDGAIRYQRITPKGNRVFCGAEEVRVQINPETNRVDVAWVQGDSFEDVKSFAETSESKWAESEVWPKLKGL